MPLCKKEPFSQDCIDCGKYTVTGRRCNTCFKLSCDEHCQEHQRVCTQANRGKSRCDECDVILQTAVEIAEHVTETRNRTGKNITFTRIS